MPTLPSTLQTLFLSLASAILIGWLLAIGKPVIVPVITAVIAVYVLTKATGWLRQWPLLRHLPEWFLHTSVLLLFALLLVALGAVIAATLDRMVDRAPEYQDNLQILVARAARMVHADSDPSWEDIRRVTLDRIDLSALIGRAFSSLAAFAGSLFLVTLYAGFLLSEARGFRTKLYSAFSQGSRAERIIEVSAEINRKVGDYLAVKTGVNVVLGILSFGVLWGMGVDFALFWALVIALANYIPYLGSWIGVMLPMALSVAQFGELWRVLLLGASLTAMQIFVGSILEPRWVGRQLNLSPFVVILALSLWSAVWGLAGAILAVPLTSVLIIVFNEFPGTRPFAALISNRAPVSGA